MHMINALFLADQVRMTIHIHILYLYKYLPPCHQNIRYMFTTFSFVFLLPNIISILMGNTFLQFIKIYIYYLYIHNIIIIIITNMTLHAQYLKVDYKSSIILYYKIYAILWLVTYFHPCTIEREHNIFYRSAWDGVVHLTFNTTLTAFYCI